MVLRTLAVWQCLAPAFAMHSLNWHNLSCSDVRCDGSKRRYRDGDPRRIHWRGTGSGGGGGYRDNDPRKIRRRGTGAGVETNEPRKIHRRGTGGGGGGRGVQRQRSSENTPTRDGGGGRDNEPRKIRRRGTGAGVETTSLGKYTDEGRGAGGGGGYRDNDPRKIRRRGTGAGVETTSLGKYTDEGRGGGGRSEWGTRKGSQPPHWGKGEGTNIPPRGLGGVSTRVPRVLDHHSGGGGGGCSGGSRILECTLGNDFPNNCIKLRNIPPHQFASGKGDNNQEKCQRCVFLKTLFHWPHLCAPYLFPNHLHTPS